MSQVTLWWNLLKVSHHPTNFGSHRHHHTALSLSKWFYFATWSCKTMCSKGHQSSYHTVDFGGHRQPGSRDKRGFFSHDLVISNGQSVIWLYGYEPLKVHHHLPKSGGHRHYGTEDIIALVCYLILQEHVIKGSCDYMVTSPSWQVTMQQKLVAITTLVMESWSCRTMWSQGHVILWIGLPYAKSPPCQVMWLYAF